MTIEPETARRVAMPDGELWSVHFRHEMAQLMRRGRERERVLYAFFSHADGRLRRAEVPDSLKESATDDELRKAWRGAESLGREHGMPAEG